MKTSMTRFTCDNPDCTGGPNKGRAIVDIPSQPGGSIIPLSQALAQPVDPQLPDGWTELTLSGPGNQPITVHAHEADCVRAVAQEQAQLVTEGNEAVEQAEEDRRKLEEGITAAAVKESDKQTKERAKMEVEQGVEADAAKAEAEAAEVSEAEPQK